MDVEPRYTRHQVPRGTRADAENFDKIYLIKNVTCLRATYQIRLLAFKAIAERKQLVLKLPKDCRIHADLRELIALSIGAIKREGL